MDKLQQLRIRVRKRHDDNLEKSYNGSSGNLYWERALEDAYILAMIDSIPRFKIGDVIKSGSYTYIINDMDDNSYILDGDKVLTFNAQYDWELVEEPQRIASSETNDTKIPVEFITNEESYWKELRNRAAIAAMKGTITILGSSDRNAFREIVVEGFKGDKKCLTTYPNEISQFAIACADALIKELKK